MSSRLVRQKEHPNPHIRIGRRVRFSEAKVEEWLESRTVNKLREDFVLPFASY